MDSETPTVPEAAQTPDWSQRCELCNHHRAQHAPPDGDGTCLAMDSSKKPTIIEPSPECRCPAMNAAAWADENPPEEPAREPQPQSAWVDGQPPPADYVNPPQSKSLFEE